MPAPQREVLRAWPHQAEISQTLEPTCFRSPSRASDQRDGKLTPMTSGKEPPAETSRSTLSTSLSWLHKRLQNIKSSAKHICSRYAHTPTYNDESSRTTLERNQHQRPRSTPQRTPLSNPIKSRTNLKSKPQHDMQKISPRHGKNFIGTARPMRQMDANLPHGARSRWSEKTPATSTQDAPSLRLLRKDPFTSAVLHSSNLRPAPPPRWRL